MTNRTFFIDIIYREGFLIVIFAENFISLDRISFFQAPADHSPTPYIIPENHNVVEVLTGGMVYFEHNNQRQQFRRGTIFWHVPGDHTIFDTTADEPYSCAVFRFQCQSNIRTVPHVSCWRGSSESLEEFIRQSYQAFILADNAPQQKSLLEAYCSAELLMHAYNLKNPQLASATDHNADTDEIILRNILMYIDKNISGDLSVSSLCAAMKQPRNRLFGLFRKQLNTTPHEYVASKRMLLARQLLESTRSPVKQIASTCGFEHVEVFHRYFVKCFQKTPREYRSNQQPYSNLPEKKLD